ncbi:glutamate receptor ionotropic, kainate 1, partial [Trichonephila inaurata madagascariensis]
KVLELTHEGLRESGEWSYQNGLNMTTNYTRAAEEIMQSLKNKTLIVTTLINAPYTMLMANHEELEGNDKYEGYCIDLLKEIAKILNFNFKIREVSDKKYGEKNEQGEWNGMIKELIDGVSFNAETRSS